MFSTCTSWFVVGPSGDGPSGDALLRWPVSNHVICICFPHCIIVFHFFWLEISDCDSFIHVRSLKRMSKTIHDPRGEGLKAYSWFVVLLLVWNDNYLLLIIKLAVKLELTFETNLIFCGKLKMLQSLTTSWGSVLCKKKAPCRLT